jgi:hypothetical protein
MKDASEQPTFDKNGSNPFFRDGETARGKRRKADARTTRWARARRTVTRRFLEAFYITTTFMKHAEKFKRHNHPLRLACTSASAAM